MVATSLGLPLEIYDLTRNVTALALLVFGVNLALVLYLVITKRLFGVRGGKKAYDARLRSESVLEAAVKAAASARRPRLASPPCTGSKHKGRHSPGLPAQAGTAQTAAAQTGCCSRPAPPSRPAPRERRASRQGERWRPPPLAANPANSTAAECSATAAPKRVRSEGNCSCHRYARVLTAARRGSNKSPICHVLGACSRPWMQGWQAEMPGSLAQARSAHRTGEPPEVRAPREPPGGEPPAGRRASPR